MIRRAFARITTAEGKSTRAGHTAHLSTGLAGLSRYDQKGETMYAQVDLFKPGGKYYTSESWSIPTDAIGPYDMERSPDFHQPAGWSVLVESQAPWGYPHLFPGDSRQSVHPWSGAS